VALGTGNINNEEEAAVLLANRVVNEHKNIQSTQTTIDCNNKKKIYFSFVEIIMINISFIHSLIAFHFYLFFRFVVAPSFIILVYKYKFLFLFGFM